MPVYHTAYLITGSNIGDRYHYLLMAEKNIAEIAIIVSKTAIYETSPWGKKNQYNYLNQVLEIRTPKGPFQLLNYLHHIEKLFSRTGKGQMTPRKMDIDILLYNNTIINSHKLTIPHPRISLRRFVLQPLAEIAPELKHPVNGQNVAEMLKNCTDNSSVRRFDP